MANASHISDFSSTRYTHTQKGTEHNFLFIFFLLPASNHFSVISNDSSQEWNKTLNKNCFDQNLSQNLEMTLQKHKILLLHLT